MEKNRGLWLIAVYFFLSIYLLPMYPHGGSPDELTRWATTASLVEKGSFEIGWTEDLIGKNVGAAHAGEQIYSSKPPGISVLSVPFYAVARVFTGAPDASNIRVSWFVMRFALSTLPLLILAFWLYSRNSDELSLAALLFATPLFVYSLLFFSHVLVGVLLYFAFRLIYDTERIFLRNCVFAGFLSGLAVVCEFPALLCVLVFGVGMFFTDRRDRQRWQHLIGFLAGALPFALLLLLYNYAVFGSPLALSYAYETFPDWAETAGQNVLSVGFPSFSNAYLLLFSPARGLFFYAPLLLLAVVAFFTSRESRTLRHRVKVAAILVAVFALCGHGAAHGGWAFGARYLIFVLPLLLDSFFDGEFYDYSNMWQGFLFGISFLLCAMPALVFPFAPPEFNFPHNDFWFAFAWRENWFVPNLANVFGAGNNFWTMLPALAAFIAIVFIVWQSMRRPQRFLIGLAAGVVLVAGYLLWPNFDSAEKEFRRATIAERFYKPENRLEKFANDPLLAARISNFERITAETRAFAPDDFPYLETRALKDSPSVVLKKAARFQAQGNMLEAENILQKGKTDFPSVRCEFSAELAAIFSLTNRKPEALQELESVQNSVTSASTANCLRAQFTLGSLYRETNQTEKAELTFRKFLDNTQNSNDAEIKSLRGQLANAK